MSAIAFADNAAAVAAGWVRLQWATGGNPAFCTRYEKLLAGDQDAPHTHSLDGGGSTQAAADTAALANLNAWRINRYGADTTRPHKGRPAVSQTHAYGVNGPLADGLPTPPLTLDVN
jgi:hypothetical protein